MAGEGESCGKATCKSGLNCISSVCAKMPVIGEPCSFANPCAGLLACVEDKCIEHADLGDACTPTDQNDHCRPTGWCPSATKVCEPYGDAAINGEPCGALDNGSIEYCARGFRCRITDKTKFQGTCEPSSQLGEACEFLYGVGDSCEFPAICMEGTCKKADWGVCKYSRCIVSEGIPALANQHVGMTACAVCDTTDR